MNFIPWNGWPQLKDLPEGLEHFRRVYARFTKVNRWYESIEETELTGNPVIVEDALKLNADSLVAQIVPIQSGTGDPSPTNVRPISGRTAVNLGRTGKNLLPMTVDGIKAANTTGTWTGNVYAINGVSFTVQTNNSNNITGIKVTGTANAESILYLGTCAVDAPIIASGCPANGSDNTYYYVFNVGGWYTYNREYGEGKTFNSGQVSDSAIVIANGYACPSNGLMFYPMLRDANVTDPTFEPYTPVTITISLGQTVYGGTLDVKTGVLRITYVMVNMGSLNWGYAIPSNVFYTNDLASLKRVKGDVICSVYRTSTYTYINMPDKSITANTDDFSPNNYLLVKDSSYSDATAFKNAMDGVQLCYELATPTTVQLTANELEMLMGYNRVTSDSGELTLTYKANAVQDLQTEKADNADMVDFIENGNKASRAYTANQFMLWKGDLYKVTTSIASGATITAGTNVTKTTIGAVLTALLNA